MEIVLYLADNVNECFMIMPPHALRLRNQVLITIDSVGFDLFLVKAVRVSPRVPRHCLGAAFKTINK